MTRTARLHRPLALAEESRVSGPAASRARGDRARFAADGPGYVYPWIPQHTIWTERFLGLRRLAP